MTDSRLGTLLGPEGYHPIWDEQRGMYQDRNGDPMTLREWVTGMENRDYRFVARDEVNGVVVITVWQGILGAFEDEAETFGTICWSEKGGYYDERLTATEAEALAEHQRRVDALGK